MSTDNSKIYKQYNSKHYMVDLKIFNPSGETWYLNIAAIDHLEIEDDLHFWPIRGFFIYQNPHEVIERVMESNTALTNSVPDAKLKLNAETNKPYVFRNDGRDYLDITINLVDPDGKLPKKQWVMTHHCVIYDKEDLTSADVGGKKKKFYFWDADYQKMLDNKIQWSTAKSTLNPTYRKLGDAYDPAQASDDERKMPTGIAIKSILTDHGFPISSNFDEGSTELFYSTYSDKNIWQNIQYLLQHHMSKKSTTIAPLNERDICIFNKERDTGEFSFIPINEFFKRAGNSPNIPKEYQLEHMYLEELVGEPSTSVLKAPKSQEYQTDKDFHSGLIKAYQFVDMSTDINTSLMVSTPVHSYDFKNKTFSINLADSNPTKIVDKVKTMYIDKNLLVKGLYPLITINKNKTDNSTIRPVYSPRSDKDAIIRHGVGDMLHWALFLNQCMRFQAVGLPIRQTGRFIGIDRMSFSDNKMDYKLLGQWFTTNVKHIFRGDGSYVNEVYAVKLHSYDDLKIDKTVA
jgi:hypothetical protein